MNQQKEILLLSITIFITVVTWIVADLYHVANTNQVKNVDKRFTKEITITLDSGILQQLQKKQ